MNTVKHRHEKQAKEADRLEPKGKRAGYGRLTWPYVNVAPSVYEVYLSYPQVIKVERGKPVYLPHCSRAAAGETVRHTCWVCGGMMPEEANASL